MRFVGSAQIITAVVVPAVVISTVATSPAPAASAQPAPAVRTLPGTGTTDSHRLTVWHDPQPGEELPQAYALYQPTRLFGLYQPPQAPAIVAWVPPAGYRTIPVPIYQQAMPLDCETGALRMGLATYGYYYSDYTLFSNEVVDSRSPVMGADHTVLQWGDPYTNFVGNVWGSDWTPTGYGIYYPPILAIARSHGLPNAYGGEGFAASTVYNELLAGHPVEIWIETNWTRPWLGTWKAWDGRPIRYSYAEHAVVLSGISSGMVRVNDPLHGTQYWVSKWLFETVWADFGNMAVVFR